MGINKIDFLHTDRDDRFLGKCNGRARQKIFIGPIIKSIKNSKRMKTIYKAMITMALIGMGIASCTNDDDESVILVSTPATFEITIESGNLIVGDTIGFVPGTSNKGSVIYEIIDQNPAGALNIAKDYGELTVADASFFKSEGVITVDVGVSKENIMQTSKVTITLEKPCPAINLRNMEGMAQVLEEGVDPIAVSTEAMACGQLKVIGDFGDFGCAQTPSVILEFLPGESDGQGSIVGASQPYGCNEGDNLTFEASGSYNLDDGEAPIDYSIFEDGEEILNASVIISVEQEECTSMVDASVWDGTVVVESIDGVFVTFDGEALANCDELEVTGDLAGYACDDVPTLVFTLTPASEGATNGVIEAARQPYGPGACYDDVFLEFEASGTYNEDTGLIELEYTVHEDGFDPVTGLTNISSK